MHFFFYDIGEPCLKANYEGNTFLIVSHNERFDLHVFEKANNKNIIIKCLSIKEAIKIAEMWTR